MDLKEAPAATLLTGVAANVRSKRHSGMRSAGLAMAVLLSGCGSKLPAGAADSAAFAESQGADSVHAILQMKGVPSLVYRPPLEASGSEAEQAERREFAREAFEVWRVRAAKELKRGPVSAGERREELQRSFGVDGETIDRYSRDAAERLQSMGITPPDPSSLLDPLRSSIFSDHVIACGEEASVVVSATIDGMPAQMREQIENAQMLPVDSNRLVPGRIWAMNVENIVLTAWVDPDVPSLSVAVAHPSSCASAKVVEAVRLEE